MSSSIINTRNNNKKETILLFALENINNVGEELLRETTEYLINSSSQNIEIKIAQFKPTDINSKKRYKIAHRLSYYVKRIAEHFTGNTSYRILNLSYLIRYTRYFEDLISCSDRVITSVGMFKYSTQDFSYIYHLIAKICQKHHKPLMISAPSIEAYNPNDWRSKQLVKAANYPSVKMISTRDGITGLKILKEHYYNTNHFLFDDVADPALWIPECYNMKRKNKNLNSTLFVGINVIRKGIFDDYNKSFKDEQLIQIYVELIKKIEKRGWNWAIYSNGITHDITVIKELQSVLSFSNDHILDQHKNAKEFIELINNFDVVFGARLHSCISAVALGIPVVGFIWDNKIKCFAETIKKQSFFFEPKEMKAENIIYTMEKAMKSEYDFKNIDYLKNKTKSTIRKFLEIQQ